MTRAILLHSCFTTFQLLINFRIVIWPTRGEEMRCMLCTHLCFTASCFPQGKEQHATLSDFLIMRLQHINSNEVFLFILFFSLLFISTLSTPVAFIAFPSSLIRRPLSQHLYHHHPQTPPSLIPPTTNSTMRTHLPYLAILVTTSSGLAIQPNTNDPWGFTHRYDSKSTIGAVYTTYAWPPYLESIRAAREKEAAGLTTFSRAERDKMHSTFEGGY